MIHMNRLLEIFLAFYYFSLTLLIKYIHPHIILRVKDLRKVNISKDATSFLTLPS
jgi:hypothetical protein